LDRIKYHTRISILKLKVSISNIKIAYYRVLKFLAPTFATIKTAQVTTWVVCIAAVKGSDAAKAYIDKEYAKMDQQLKELKAQNIALENKLKQYKKRIQHG